MEQGSLECLLVVEDSSLEGAPPHSVGPHRWGDSGSSSGQIHLSVVKLAGLRRGDAPGDDVARVIVDDHEQLVIDARLGGSRKLGDARDHT